MAPTVALSVITRGGPDRIRALVDAVRPHVDEVVIGLDPAAAPGTAASLQGVCDRLWQFEPLPQSSMVHPHQLLSCGTDWMLRFDDDEMPSPALLEALPELVADRRVSQFQFRRRWLWPDGDRFITTFPWGFEPAGRLTRNVAGLLQADGRMHSDEAMLGERRLTDLAFYHADLLAPVGHRRAKAARYELLRPGLRYGDFPVNGIYLPEDTTGVELAPVPAADVALVRRLVDPPPIAVTGEDPALPVVTLDEIGAALAARDPGDGLHEGAVELVGTPSRVRADVVHQQELRVTNRGTGWWLAGDRPQRPILVGWRWFDEGTGEQLFEGRDLLPETVRPGETRAQVVSIRTPARPGRHRLEVRMVHERVCWFADPAVVDLEVVDAAEHLLLR